jgi:hypothetical protein
VDPDSDEIVPAAGMRVHLERWTPEQRVFSTQSAAPVDLALRLVNYPAWEAHIDGQQATIGSHPETAQMVLAIPAGAHKIEMCFRRTPDRAAGDTISVLSALLMIAFTCIQRSKPAWTDLLFARIETDLGGPGERERFLYFAVFRPR